MGFKLFKKIVAFFQRPYSPDLERKQPSAPPLEVEEERQLPPPLLIEAEYWMEVERYQNRVALRQFLARRGIGLASKLKPLTVVEPFRC